jgi:hypothetical protein
MSSAIASRVRFCIGAVVAAVLGPALLWFAMATPAVAQVYGVPPSVTSLQFHVPPFLPNIRPSVTSLGPYGYGHNPGLYGPYSGRRGNGYRTPYGYGTSAWIAPYYYPIYDSSDGYDSAGSSPYLYSGPPPEQTQHIVVDTPPTRRDAVADDDDDAPAVAVTPKSKRESDARPVDPTVLVFRDGHQQEVSNYAIMGQTVYVFDDRKQKIALGDLDVPATIKANDDRGVEFQLPNPKQS